MCVGLMHKCRGGDKNEGNNWLVSSIGTYTIRYTIKALHPSLIINCTEKKTKKNKLYCTENDS